MKKAYIFIDVGEELLDFEALFDSPPMVGDVIRLEYVEDGKVAGCGEVVIKSRSWISKTKRNGTLVMKRVCIDCDPNPESAEPFVLNCRYFEKRKDA